MTVNAFNELKKLLIRLWYERLPLVEAIRALEHEDPLLSGLTGQISAAKGHFPTCRFGLHFHVQVKQAMRPDYPLQGECLLKEGLTPL